ncbi:MAG: hypothetical protein HY275_12580, partial [Gemmatimonadetes bacterium]|nr:hypothetical protein [Gemmatimonadota bacterium]
MNASPDSSATIRLHLLGSVRLVGVPAADALLAQTRRTAVLAWLGIRQGAGFLRRDSLATMFWPEHDTASARGALRKVLHHLREALGEAAILARGDEEVRLDPAVVWCDVTALRDAHRRGAHAEALALYGAPLLDGFHANAPDFERLVATERRELAELAASLAWQLAESHDTNHDATQAGRLARSA